MDIKIDEEEMREWAIKQIQKRMGDRINSLMREWDWERYMRSAIDKAVSEKVTDDAIKGFIGSVDKSKVIKAISEHLANEIADSLQN